MTSSTVRIHKLTRWIVTGLAALTLLSGPIMIDSAEAGCSGTSSTTCSG